MTRPSSISPKPADIRSMTREEMIDEAVRRAWGRYPDAAQGDGAKPILVEIGGGYKTEFYPAAVAEKFSHVLENINRIAAREANT